MTDTYEQQVEKVARAICMERASPGYDCRADGTPCRAPLENLLHPSNAIGYQARAALAALSTDTAPAPRCRECGATTDEGCACRKPVTAPALAISGGEMLTEEVELAAWMAYVDAAPDSPDQEGLRAALRAALAAADRSAAAPAPDMVSVPREATPEMLAAFWRQKNTGTQEPGEWGHDRDDYSAYRAMIAAAAPAPQQGDG